MEEDALVRVVAIVVVEVDDGGAIAGVFNVLDNDTDPDSVVLNATLVSAPANSALFELRPDGTFDYTHNGSETTSDSFTYQICDAIPECHSRPT